MNPSNETIIAVRELPDCLRKVLDEVGYKRRDISVRPSTTFSAAGAGGNGYQCFSAVVSLQTGQYRVLWGSWGGANYYSPNNPVDLDTSSRELPVDHVFIGGSRGGGRPVWAYMKVHPDNVTKLLPAPPEATDDELRMLATIDGLKSSGRRDAFRRNGFGQYGPNHPTLQDLGRRGFLKIAKNGSIRLTTEGRNAARQAPGHLYL